MIPAPQEIQDYANQRAGRHAEKKEPASGRHSHKQDPEKSDNENKPCQTLDRDPVGCHE